MASAQAVHRRRSWSSPTCDFFRRSAHNRRCRHRASTRCLLATAVSDILRVGRNQHLAVDAWWRRRLSEQCGSDRLVRRRCHARFDALFGCRYGRVHDVVHDAHTLRSLVEVLQGSFQCVTVGELRAKGGTRQPHVADGLFAVPPSVRRQERALRPVNDRGRKEAAAPTTKLLQVVRWHDVAGVRGGRGGVRPDAPW